MRGLQHERRVERTRDVEPYRASAYAFGYGLKSRSLAGDDRLSRRVEVGRNDDAVRFFGDPGDLHRVSPDQGHHPTRVLLRSLVHQPIPLRHEPHPVLEPQTPRRVGGGILAQRVSGYYVRLDASISKLVEKIDGAREDR